MAADSKKVQLRQLQSRLFGVGCDAEEDGRWYEASCIFEYLGLVSPPDLELALRRTRVAIELGHRSLVRRAAMALDKAVSAATPAERSPFLDEIDVVRRRVEALVRQTE